MVQLACNPACLSCKQFGQRSKWAMPEYDLLLTGSAYSSLAPLVEHILIRDL